MNQQKPDRPILYSDDWISHARNHAPERSWAGAAVRDDPDRDPDSGELYLHTLRTWFRHFPAPWKEIMQRLESHVNADHLGAVNELFWWEFMELYGVNAEPISDTQEHPDFHVLAPADFFCEVTTLNVSEDDQAILSGQGGVSLDPRQSLGRITRKIEDKRGQIQYGALRQKPSVLVLFDYTFGSAFATQFYDDLRRWLFDDEDGRSRWSDSLSAIVYVERKIHQGRFGMSILRSAVYHNPRAPHQLSTTVFRMIRQYTSTGEETPPAIPDWLWV